MRACKFRVDNGRGYMSKCGEPATHFDYTAKREDVCDEHKAAWDEHVREFKASQFLTSKNNRLRNVLIWVGLIVLAFVIICIF